MVATGTIIAANDYNTIQSLVNQVLGPNIGGGTFGYGQSVASSQVSQYSKITMTQWRTLREDILRCRLHQTGVDYGSSLTYPTADVKVSAADREAYLTMMQTAALDTNRLAVPPTSQASREPVVTNQVRTTVWKTTITQTVTVTFNGYTVNTTTLSGADHMRCYFNAGGRFEFSSTITGGTTGTIGTKDYSWNILLSGMGTVYFNRTNTTATGTGTGSSVGYASLTATNQQIFQKDTTAGYSPNRYRILARSPATNQIVFTIYWEDLSGQPNAPWGTDENVTGTVTSFVQVYRPSGVNSVTIPIPAATTTSLV